MKVRFLTVVKAITDTESEKSRQQHMVLNQDWSRNNDIVLVVSTASPILH